MKEKIFNLFNIQQFNIFEASILHRYIRSAFIKNSSFVLVALVLLFLLIDVTDRIDTILNEDASFWTAVTYFALKIPNTLILTLPISLLLGSLITITIFQRNSELIIMRSAGMKLIEIFKPILSVAFIASFIALFLNETVVPAAQTKMRGIYSEDIQKKSEKGELSNENIWWRDGNVFYSADTFDSKKKSLSGISALTLSGKSFAEQSRIVALEGVFLSKELGWNLKNAQLFEFNKKGDLQSIMFEKLALPISQTPKSFFDTKTETDTMSFRELNDFISHQGKNGLNVIPLKAELYEKVAFPFVNFVVVLAALGLSIRPARSTDFGVVFLMGLSVVFVYFTLHSFALSLGKAESFPPMLSAWTANIILLGIGTILHLGSENPR